MGRIARVAGVIAAPACARSRLRVSRSQSTNTGLAPTLVIMLAAAKKVCVGVITSSPAPMPHSCRATSIATVADVIERTGRPPQYTESDFSNASTFGPLAIQLLRMTSATQAIVASSITGRANGRNAGELMGGTPG